MASWEDVARIALSLPETTASMSRSRPAWKVHTATFAWERDLRPKDLAELGDAAPDGPILGAHGPDEGAKHALIADDPSVYFTTSHFNGYPAVLVRLDAIAVPDLEELLTEAWLAKAPKRVAQAWLDSRS